MPVIGPAKQTQPSYASGYAKSASESANPNLWDGLVASWVPNLGVTGDSLRDISGKGSHATGDNFDVGTDWGITEVGPALTLNGDGSEGMLTSVSAGDLVGTGNERLRITLSFWVKLNLVHQGMILGGTNGGGDRFYIECFGSNPAFHWGFGDSNNAGDSNALYTVGKWHHYAAVRIGGTVIDYLDGIEVGRAVGISSGGYTTNPIGIGYYNNGSLGFDGDIGLCQIWNRPLRAGEVAEIAADPMGMFRQRRYAPVSLQVEEPSFNNWYARPGRKNRIIGSGVHV